MLPAITVEHGSFCLTWNRLKHMSTKGTLREQSARLPWAHYW